MSEFLISSDSPIHTYEVINFEELRELIENDISNIEDYVFRGQSNANWPLQSTLDRLIIHARSTGAKHGSVDPFVKKHLDRFRMEIRGRRGDNPSKLDEDELWALGQHFGLATPLLDWSQSPYISIFFALNRLQENNFKCALWCLNSVKVKEISNGLANAQKLDLITPDSDDNKRLLGQSGLFSKGPVEKNVDAWVLEKSHPGSKDPVLLKIAFPGNSSFRKQALKKLNMMNINHSSLFPDLSGACQHCNIIAEDYGI